MMNRQENATLLATPLSMREANAFVANHHRHSKPVKNGYKFAMAARDGLKLVGVVIVGRPVARALDDGRTAEMLRICVLPDAPKGTCAFLLQVARRAWQAMGGTRCITYTLDSESGASMRGAGWNPQKVQASGKRWVARGLREGRPRAEQAIYDSPKIRWETSCAPPRLRIGEGFTVQLNGHLAFSSWQLG